jgi:predicted adenylyl cyclase CyaB
VSFLNIEIKARCSSLDLVRRILKERKATFKGVDRQVDTYFDVPRGRLKLREGNIENNLIHYCREDEVGPKKSIVTLHHSVAGSTLKGILTNSLGVLVVVEKVREIYFIDNVKFHIDTVNQLGTFVEIEAIDSNEAIGEETLQKQCEEYMNLFGIRAEDLINHSYSDMILHPEMQAIQKRALL